MFTPRPNPLIDREAMLICPHCKKFVYLFAVWATETCPACGQAITHQTVKKLVVLGEIP